MFPPSLGIDVDEIHVEWQSREFSEIPIIHQIAQQRIDVAVGVIDVKSSYSKHRKTWPHGFVYASNYAPADDCHLHRIASVADGAMGREIETPKHGSRVQIVRRNWRFDSSLYNVTLSFSVTSQENLPLGTS
jgi:hypothetical protein